MRKYSIEIKNLPDICQCKSNLKLDEVLESHVALPRAKLPGYLSVIGRSFDIENLYLNL